MEESSIAVGPFLVLHTAPTIDFEMSWSKKYKSVNKLISRNWKKTIVEHAADNILTIDIWNTVASFKKKLEVCKKSHSSHFESMFLTLETFC